MLGQEHFKNTLTTHLDLERLSNSGLGRSLTNQLSHQQQLKLPRRDTPDELATLYAQLKKIIYQKKDKRYLLQAKKENEGTPKDKILALFMAIWECLLEQDQRLAPLEQEQHEGQFINSYEEQLVKLEADVRQHIRIEQQLKLYGESTQQKLDDALKQNHSLKQHIAQLNSQLASHRNSRDQCSSLMDDPNASTLQNASTLHNHSNPPLHNCSKQFYSKIDRKESEVLTILYTSYKSLSRNQPMYSRNTREHHYIRTTLLQRKDHWEIYQEYRTRRDK